MYEQPTDILFYMIYGGVAALAVAACGYLLFRRGNAFAPEITTPARLRLWTAALFAVIALSHVWYIPVAFLSSGEEIMLAYLVGALLDSLIFFPVTIAVMFVMLQDRRRPLWPIAIAVAPIVIMMTVCIASGSDSILPALYIYLVLSGIVLIIYMVRALRQYGTWLRDNFADLEHKEVWQSFVVFAVILLMLVIYASGVGGDANKYIINLDELILICYLLWRVETLTDLNEAQSAAYNLEAPASETENDTEVELPEPEHDYIGPLLQRHCIDTQLFLQHDLTLSQLAKAVGTNHFYLSEFFSSQGITYNTYINNLRINHFISLYHKAVADNTPFTAQQLASDSGYRSYSTFSHAFKQRVGQNVSAWMREAYN